MRLTRFYLATPLFLLLEPLGFPLRAAFIPDLGGRLLYYAFCFACGVLAWRVPRAEPFVAVGESTVAVTLLMVGFLAPLYAPEVWLTTGGESPFTASIILNFALSATVLWLGFQRGMLRLGAAARDAHPLHGRGGR